MPMPRVRNSSPDHTMDAVTSMEIDASNYGRPSSDAVSSACYQAHACGSPRKSTTGTNAIPTPSPSPTSSPTRAVSLRSPKFVQRSPIYDPVFTANGSTEAETGTQTNQQQKRKHIALCHPSHPRTNPSHIPRPRNAFILFRSYMLSTPNFLSSHSNSGRNANGGGGGRNGSRAGVQIQIPIQQNEASREIAKIWRSVDAATRERFEEMAREEKRRHREMYPDYRYAPKKQQSASSVSTPARTSKTNAANGKSVKARKGKDEEDDDELYVPGGRKKNQTQARRQTQLKKQSKAYATKRRTPLTPETTPEPSPTRPLAEIEDDDDEDDDLDFDQNQNDAMDEEQGESSPFASLFQSIPASETKMCDLPHPEFSCASDFNPINYDYTADSDPSLTMIDETRVPLLASSAYYAPTFTHVDRTRTHTHAHTSTVPSSPFTSQASSSGSPGNVTNTDTGPLSFPRFLLKSEDLNIGTQTQSAEDEERALIRRALRPFAPLWSFEERKRSQGGLESVFPPSPSGASNSFKAYADADENVDLDAMLAEMVHLDMLSF